MPGSTIITLLTDFGLEDAFVGIMKGVILSINPEARLVDLTHAVPPQQILAGALVLRSAARAFPSGTIHVAVVDPGVGSARRPILVETGGGFLVGPDNGVLAPAATALGRRTVRLIDNATFFRRPVSHTFHGRDIFAPVAAHLSRGIAPESFGPSLDAMVELALPTVQRTPGAIAGEILYTDHFGNLVTNIEAEAIASFSAERVSVSIGDTCVAGLVTAYTAVAEGQALAIVGSWGMVEVAVRNGDAAKMFAAGPGTRVTVVVELRKT